MQWPDPLHTRRYGLFRQMTGVGDSGEGRIVARPELDFQGSDDGETWQSYIFRCGLEMLRQCHCHAPLSWHPWALLWCSACLLQI